MNEFACCAGMYVRNCNMPLAYILQSPTPRDAWSRMAPPKATCGHGWLCLCAHLPGSTKGHEVKCASRSSHQEPPRPCLTPQAVPPFGSEHVLLAPPGHLRRGSHNLTILPFFWIFSVSCRLCLLQSWTKGRRLLMLTGLLQMIMLTEMLRADLDPSAG
jgi:hypothetical protein